jgi:hypothetical protein
MPDITIRLTPDDLDREAKNKPIRDIGHHDFSRVLTQQMINRASLIIYETDCYIKFIKTRKTVIA